MNNTDTFVPVFAKILEGIEITPFNQCLSIILSLIAFSIPDWAVIKPVGTTIAALPFSFNEYKICWINNV